jgi:hypothetical protein
LLKNESILSQGATFAALQQRKFAVTNTTVRAFNRAIVQLMSLPRRPVP